MLLIECPYCETENKIHPSDDGIQVGDNLKQCSNCDNEFWFEANITWNLRSMGKTPINKPTYCPNCRFELTSMVTPWSICQTSMCPQCHQPYCVKIEKEPESA